MLGTSSGNIQPRWQKRAHVSFPSAVTIMQTGKSTAGAIRPRRTSELMLLSLITLSGVYPPATSVHPGVPRSVIAGARWPSRGRSVSRPRVYRQILQKASRGRGGINAHSSGRSEEHTSELQSLMRISYAVICLKQKIYKKQHKHKKT